jgi:chemotaxis signal transduction protein
LQYSDEKTRKILQERAAKLAIPEKISTAQDTQQSKSFVMVEICDETFGFEQEFVKEVILLRNMAVLPGLPPQIKGIIYQRGRMVAVNSLTEIFDLEASSKPEERVMIAEKDGLLMGFLIDSVKGTKDINEREIQQELPNMSELQKELTIGLSPQGESLVSLGKLFNHPALVLK